MSSCSCHVCGQKQDERTILIEEVDNELYFVCDECDQYYDQEELHQKIRGENYA